MVIGSGGNQLNSALYMYSSNDAYSWMCMYSYLPDVGWSALMTSVPERFMGGMKDSWVAGMYACVIREIIS